MGDDLGVPNCERCLVPMVIAGTPMKVRSGLARSAGSSVSFETEQAPAAGVARCHRSPASAVVDGSCSYPAGEPLRSAIEGDDENTLDARTAQLLEAATKLRIPAAATSGIPGVRDYAATVTNSIHALATAPRPVLTDHRGRPPGRSHPDARESSDIKPSLTNVLSVVIILLI
jgi:hypothetical protein